jgi:hypothetical protein
LPALILTFSPGEKEKRWGAFGFVNGHPANSIAGFSKRRRKILLLLGEKAGMREEVVFTAHFC